MSTLYGCVAWHVPDTFVCVATSNIFLPPTTISFTTTTATLPMPPKPQSKAPTKATADSRKRQALNADQQPVKRSRRGTKPNNNNRNDNNNDDLKTQRGRCRGPCNEGKRKGRKEGNRRPEEERPRRRKVRCTHDQWPSRHRSCALSSPFRTH